jgi:lipopolysaccharide transport system ATP-binding protein
VLFVSHDVSAVKSLCDHVILLDEGRIIEQGDPSSVIDLYSNLIAQDVHQGESAMNINRKLSSLPRREGGSGAPGPDATLHDGFTTGETELLSFVVCDPAGKEVTLVTSEHLVEVRFELRANKDLDQPHFSIMIRNRFGFPVFATSTYFMGLQPAPMRAGQVVRGAFSLRLNLAAENYSLSFSANNRGYNQTLFEEYLILVHDLAVVQVLQNNEAILYHGVFNMHPEFTATVEGEEEEA